MLFRSELIEKIDSIRTDNAKQLAYYLRMVTRNRTIDFMRKWDRRSALSYDAVDVEPASLHEDAADVVLTKMRLETTLKDYTILVIGYEGKWDQDYPDSYNGVRPAMWVNVGD